MTVNQKQKETDKGLALKLPINGVIFDIFRRTDVLKLNT